MCTIAFLFSLLRRVLGEESGLPPVGWEFLTSQHRYSVVKSAIVCTVKSNGTRR